MELREQLRRDSLETLDRLIEEKRDDPGWAMWPHGTVSEARRAVYGDILNGFRDLEEAREYIDDMPEDNVIFTARGDEITFFLIGLVLDDIERNPWLSPYRPEEAWYQRPLLPAIPGDDLRRIADKYGWWAARQAEALCPHGDVACVEREARRLHDIVRIRRGR